jgi:hypothetical protein
MRRTLTTLMIVLALMGLSISAIADDDDGEDAKEPEVELLEQQAEAGFLVSIENSEVTFDEDLLSIEFDFGDLEATHGHYVATAVHLLKAYEPGDIEGFDFDPSQYRLGCLVKQFAQSDLGKDEAAEVPSFDEAGLKACLKKKYNDDWTPPGKAKKGKIWEPPGQANKP